MKNKPKLKDSASLFAALGDETRMSLINSLCDKGPQSISSLAKGKGVSRQAITKHLETLRAAGLAHCHFSGRENIWDLDQRRFRIAQELLEHVSNRWDLVLSRLKDLVEE